LWAIVCPKHAHWEAALAKLRTVEGYGNSFTCRGEVNLQVVPLTILNLSLVLPCLGVVIIWERDKPEFATAVLVAWRQQANNVAGIGPKQQLHIGANVSHAFSLEREGEGNLVCCPALAVWLSIAKLHVCKCAVWVLTRCCLVNSDLPTILLSERVLSRIARPCATPTTTIASASTSRDVWVAASKIL